MPHSIRIEQHTTLQQQIVMQPAPAGMMYRGVPDVTVADNPAYAPPTTYATLATPVLQTADPITNQNESLSALLMRNNLSQYETTLCELGAVQVADLLDLDQAECEGVGMKPVEARRLLRVASATATQSDV